MKLIIKIEKDQVCVILSQKEAQIDEIGFPLDHNLSGKLLPTIDEMLQKHRLEPKDVEKAEFSGEINESYTTYRIAKAVVDAFNWGKTSN